MREELKQSIEHTKAMREESEKNYHIIRQCYLKLCEIYESLRVIK